jgi:DNA recombination protein RmuC
MSLVAVVVIVALALVAVAAIGVVVAAVAAHRSGRAVAARLAADGTAAGADAAEAVRQAVAAVSAQLERQLAAGSREAGVRDDALQRQLVGMADHLRHVSDLVAGLEQQRAGQLGELLARVTEAQRATEALAGTTEGLQRALANPQARGQWGERMAADVLAAAGFLEGVNFVRQRTLADGSRPDLTFLLPDDRVLHMDVKFPMAAYLRWCEADTDAARSAALAEFLRDARARVRELATRTAYADDTTVGFVLLFIPNESVYGFIHGNDPRLADEALAQRVVLCSPFTLFAVLGVIRQSVDAMALQRGADEILEVLAGFTHQWDQFCTRLEALGKHLQTATNSYEQLSGPRRRQLERQLDRVEAIRRERGLAPAASADDDAVLREVSAW